MLKPRYKLEVEDGVLAGRAGKYDVWATPFGIECTYMDGNNNKCYTRHTWSRFRAGAFNHWPENLKLKLTAIGAMMEIHP